MNEDVLPQLAQEDKQNLEAILDRVETGRAALFVGAGMSIDSGGPTAGQLASELCQAFAPDLDPQLGLPLVMDRLQTRRNIDRIDLDAWIAERLDRLQPSAQHLVVPRFSWPAIFTTNYDRLIEKGYDSQPERAQRLQIIRSAYEDYDIYDSSVVNLFKLHGCISRLQDPRAPLVNSLADFRRTREARAKMLKRLGDLQRANTWLFVGYSFRDNVITELLQDLKDTIGEHLLRWSFAVLPHVSEYDRDFMRSYKVNAIELGAEAFFQMLDEKKNRFSAPSQIRITGGQPIRQFVKDPQFHLLDNQFEWVGLKPFGSAAPASLYRGNTPTWADLEAGLDVRRNQADELEEMARALLQRAKGEEGTRTGAIVVSGSAGTGKSTLLRRVAYDLHSSSEVTLLVVREGAAWEATRVAHISRMLGRPVVILIEAGELDYQRLRTFHRTLVNQDVPAVVLIGARSGPWITVQRRWGVFVADHTIEINERFTDDEVRALIDKLAAHGFLEVTAVTDVNYWLSRAKAARRLILVVLLELVQGGRFEEIVLSEYQGLEDGLAEAAYRSVAVIHELGLTVRRELLRRMLDCSWDDFIERVLQGAANKVVIEDYETSTSKAFYRTKHSLISRIIREHTVEVPLHTFKHLLRNVDTANQDDKSTVRAILRSDGLTDVLPEHSERREIFEVAVEVYPEDVVIRHQMGISEMESHELEEARRIFETCLSLSPNNPAVIHSFGQLELERAKQVRTGPLKELIYSKALDYFMKVISSDPHSEYGYHSVGALYLNRAYAEASATRKMEFVGEAFTIVELGLSEIDANEVRRLYDLKGQILELLGQLHAAREEYASSIERGTATPFTYYLLARLKLEDGDEEAATELTDRGLKKYEEDARLLALRAEIVLRKQPSRHEAVQVLGPAVRANPNRLSLRFTYAVALYELGQIKSAKEQFDRTRKLSTGMFGPARVRKTLQDSAGHDIIFEGVIERTAPRGGYLAVQRSDNQDCLYYNVRRATAAGMHEGTRVRFTIGFSYRGTIALNLQPVTSKARSSNP